jgi:hypothetical protein
MRITPDFSTTRFEDAEDGALLIAVMDVQGQHVVRGMKASHQSEDGQSEAYFVTLGPFVSHHGDRPVVYPPADLSDKPVIDVTGCCSLALPVSPEDTETEAAEEEGAPGEIFLTDERAVMRVANFGRAGGEQTIGLDLVTGELVDLPDSEGVLSFRRWRIVGTGGDGAPTSEFEFSL